MQLRQEYSLCRVYKQSKCLRAFDRRPTAPVDLVAPQQEDLPAGSVEASSSNRNFLGKERICSSSAGDGFSDDDGDLPMPPSQAAGPDDNHKSLNWDQLNWFPRME